MVVEDEEYYFIFIPRLFLFCVAIIFLMILCFLCVCVYLRWGSDLSRQVHG
jgi:hypothetical protein